MNLESIARATYERWIHELGTTSDPPWPELDWSIKDAWGRIAATALQRAREVGVVAPVEAH
jgi:hypothetical protein